MEKQMYRQLIIVLTAVAVILGLSIHAAADTTPEDAADYRVAIMTTLRGHIGASSMTVRGLVEDRGQLVNHAQGLANGVMELGNIFPRRLQYWRIGSVAGHLGKAGRICRRNYEGTGCIAGVCRCC